jgi:hypothetical protein
LVFLSEFLAVEHTVGDDLIKPYLVETVMRVLEEKHGKEVDRISVSNCIIYGRSSAIREGI